MTAQNISDAAARVALAWRSDGVTHVDTLHLNACTPMALVEALGLPLEPGTEAQVAAAALRLPERAVALQMVLPRSAFVTRPSRHVEIQPAIGRWYPARCLRLPATTATGAVGFCVIRLDPNQIEVDLNHPLAGRVLRARIDGAAAAAAPAGFSPPPPAAAVAGWLAGGPGLQARRTHALPDYLGSAAMARDDHRDDALFYAQPRLVQHIDAACRQTITECYAEALTPGGRVLDLMSSWVSHLPDAPVQGSSVGVGLNAEELAANQRLDAWHVLDLNTRAELPFASAHFDTVVCTVSVEYLVRPLAVFKEVARVLRPGGRFVCTFSERWFPSKAVRIWAALQPYERLHMVASLYLGAGGFEAPHTWTLRGVPRPPDDPYVAHTEYADPVYAVSAVRAAPHPP